MKVGIHWSMGLLLFVPGSPLTAAAGHHAAKTAETQIVWIRPERVPVARRRALTRLMEDAVRGLPLRGVEVRDSRPQPHAADLAGTCNLDCVRSQAAPGKK
jgi:hypothetical protein